MSIKIAVAGKGGCGKTSITALVIRYLKNNGKTSDSGGRCRPERQSGGKPGIKSTSDHRQDTG